MELLVGEVEEDIIFLPAGGSGAMDVLQCICMGLRKRKWGWCLKPRLIPSVGYSHHPWACQCLYCGNTYELL